MTMFKGTNLRGLVLMTLLALIMISDAGFASGDLFKDYQGCPVKTRLPDGTISNLTLARDADEENKLHVSWTTTAPATWQLGPQAHNTVMAVILDDGNKHHTRNLRLGTHKTTFDKVRTGAEVTVQIALVTNVADDAYVISNIVQKDIHQSLTEPAFFTGWRRVSAEDNAAEDPTKEFVLTSTAVGAGRMYYIGYNENFSNYRSTDDDLETQPLTPRFRIGLVHAATEDGAMRDTVDFDAYIIRITDEDGDMVPEGNEVSTMASDYGTTDYTIPGGGDISARTLQTDNKLFVYDLTDAFALQDDGTYDDDTLAGYALSNVRIIDGVTMSLAMHNVIDVTNHRNGQLEPDAVPASMVRVNALGAAGTAAVGDLFAEPPNEHRDFPDDIIASDTSYTITAWAINDLDEVISPVATLKVRSIDTFHGPVTGFQDYLLTAPVNLDDLTTVQFTVLLE